MKEKEKGTKKNTRSVEHKSVTLFIVTTFFCGREKNGYSSKLFFFLLFHLREMSLPSLLLDGKVVDVWINITAKAQLRNLRKSFL